MRDDFEQLRREDKPADKRFSEAQVKFVIGARVRANRPGSQVHSKLGIIRGIEDGQYVVLIDGEMGQLRKFEGVELVGVGYDPEKIVQASEAFKAALRGGPMAHNTPAENDRIIFAGYEPENRPAELKKVRTSDPVTMARMLVQREHYPNLPLDEIYVTWFCSALRNWKALVSTNVMDNCYYELTHDGARGENGVTYIDKYTKVANKAVAGDVIVHAELPKL